jgi:hypothetical protein
MQMMIIRGSRSFSLATNVRMVVWCRSGLESTNLSNYTVANRKRKRLN